MKLKVESGKFRRSRAASRRTAAGRIKPTKVSRRVTVQKFLRMCLCAAVFVTLSLSLFTSCKKYSAECELIVMPRLMQTQGSDELGAAYMVRVYSYYISEKDALSNSWRPESYADADAGIVRHRTTGEVRAHSLVDGQGPDTYVRIMLSRSPVLLVAVDPVSRFYACRIFRYEIPLSEIRVPVTFKAWQWAQPYKENEWTITSEKSEDIKSEN